MATSPVKIIQISDCHLLADPEGALLGVKTQESLQAVIDLISQEQTHPDFILLTGDISQDGSAKSYQRISQVLKPLNVPVYWVPGNHDDNKMMLQVFPDDTISNHKHIILKNWHVILLNSQIPEAVEGFLDVSQLTYLQHCLQTYPEHDALIVFHHQPIAIGSAWIDKIGLKNATQLWDILAHYPKVSTILFGHVHQETENKVGHIRCLSLPSTCVQFKGHQAHFELENLPPGYRVIYLHEDGHIETEIKRVAEYVGHFEPNAKGY